MRREHAKIIDNLLRWKRVDNAQKSEAENGRIRKQHDDDFKKNAVKLSHTSPKQVRKMAADLGIHENMLYNWRRKYTAEGDKTKYATFRRL